MPSTGARFLATKRPHGLVGDSTRQRAYADTAWPALREELRSLPDEPLLHAGAGVALAMLGRAEEAAREAELTTSLLPVSADGVTGVILGYEVLRTYVLTGQVRDAIDLAGHLLRVPGFLTPGWLRIDPHFEGVRSHPAFQQLLRRGEQ